MLINTKPLSPTGKNFVVRRTTIPSKSSARSCSVLHARRGFCFVFFFFWGLQLCRVTMKDTLVAAGKRASKKPHPPCIFREPGKCIPSHTTPPPHTITTKRRKTPEPGEGEGKLSCLFCKQKYIPEFLFQSRPCVQFSEEGFSRSPPPRKEWEGEEKPLLPFPQSYLREE